MSSLPFDPPTMLAPMEGVTHPTFRAIMAERGGLGIVCTEFVRITSSAVSADALGREVVKAPGLPLSVQVMGNDAERMSEAAEIVSALGADVVDINLGCPMPRIVKKGVGAAMLKDPALLERVVGRMRARTRGKLSAKIRAGWDPVAGEGAIDEALAIARVVVAAGVDYLVVHPRRRADFYDGVADWRIVAALARELPIPVVGNGDVWYAGDALRLEREARCAGVMLGRPALRNPWIFEQVADLRAGRAPRRPTGDDLFGHLERVVVRYEPIMKRTIGPLKELLTYVLRAVPGGRATLGVALREQTVSGVMMRVQEALAGRPAEALDLDAHGSLGLEPRAVASRDAPERASRCSLEIPTRANLA